MKVHGLSAWLELGFRLKLGFGLALGLGIMLNWHGLPEIYKDVKVHSSVERCRGKRIHHTC